MKTGASFSRGSSRQDYGTPPEFIAAVERKFGRRLAFDLAAAPETAKADQYFTKEQDSLRQDWHKIGGLLWLNPPFANIAPWAEKCACEVQLGAEVLFLVPASVGAVWFARWVFPFADVHFLTRRLSFDGKAPFPKDCILAYYSPLWPAYAGFACWDWRKDATPAEQIKA